MSKVSHKKKENDMQTHLKELFLKTSLHMPVIQVEVEELVIRCDGKSVCFVSTLSSGCRVTFRHRLVQPIVRHLQSLDDLGIALFSRLKQSLSRVGRVLAVAYEVDGLLMRIKVTGSAKCKFDGTYKA